MKRTFLGVAIAAASLVGCGGLSPAELGWCSLTGALTVTERLRDEGELPQTTTAVPENLILDYYTGSIVGPYFSGSSDWKQLVVDPEQAAQQMDDACRQAYAEWRGRVPAEATPASASAAVDTSPPFLPVDLPAVWRAEGGPTAESGGVSLTSFDEGRYVATLEIDRTVSYLCETTIYLRPWDADETERLWELSASHDPESAQSRPPSLVTEFRITEAGDYGLGALWGCPWTVTIDANR